MKIAYSVGTTIEIPRGRSRRTVAQTAEFFSFGTNDLTQTCLGMSRDDSGSPYAYTESEIMKKNPFASMTKLASASSCRSRRRRARRPAWHQARHLRRTRRRPRFRQVLPSRWPDLRELLAVSRAGRASRCGPSGHRREAQGKDRQEVTFFHGAARWKQDNDKPLVGRDGFLLR